MPAAWVGAAAAGAGLVGDFMSSQGASASNAQNLGIAQMNNMFNAQQASINRNFQATELKNTEQYNARMSDTAMQRRVMDLKAAGLNPMLAIGQGGASAPQMAPTSGSTASASGNPVMQNPDAAFAQMGNQMSSAMQASTAMSEIHKNEAAATAALAQAKQTTGDTKEPGQTPQLVDAQIASTTANATQANAQANALQHSVGQIDAQIKKIEADTAGQGITNQYLPALQNLAVQLGRTQLQLNQLQVPKQQAEAGIASWANKGISNIGTVTDAAGSYIGNKAADVHDWLNAMTDKVSNWWNSASRQSAPRAPVPDPTPGVQ